jgi:hypothetical protein
VPASHTSLIESQALASLLRQLGEDRAALARFLNDFIVLWDSRAQRLVDALELADAEAAHVVLLSIRSTSHMLGAQNLHAVAVIIHTALQDGDLAACRFHLPRLFQVGAQTCRALEEQLPAY